jgi:hypothetical protein
MNSTPESAAVTPSPPQASPGRGRDWVAWYDALEPRERRLLRDRLLTASPDDVKGDADLRTFFLFHTEDLLADDVPGTRRLAELHQVLMALRGRVEPEVVEARRKATLFLLAEYQAVLRDNPFLA